MIRNEYSKNNSSQKPQKFFQSVRKFILATNVADSKILLNTLSGIFKGYSPQLLESNFVGHSRWLFVSSKLVSIMTAEIAISE